MATPAERAERRRKLASLETSLKADQEALAKRRQEREAKRAALKKKEDERRVELDRIKDERDKRVSAGGARWGAPALCSRLRAGPPWAATLLFAHRRGLGVLLQLVCLAHSWHATAQTTKKEGEGWRWKVPLVVYVFSALPSFIFCLD